EPEPIAFSQADPAEQRPQLVIAALHVANRVSRHALLEAGIEPPVLDRLGDVLSADGRDASEVRYGTGYAQHALVGTRRQQQARERVTQQLVAVAVGGAVPVDL